MLHASSNKGGNGDGIGMDQLDKAPLLRGSSDEERAALHWPTTTTTRSLATGTIRTIAFSVALSSLLTFAVLALSVGLGRPGPAHTRAWPWPAEVDVGCAAHSAWSVAPTAAQTIDLGNATSLPAWVDPAVGLADFDDEGPLDLSALAGLCDGVEFVPGRWLSSEDSEGGVGNIRNTILHLVRYSIEGGAGLVLPSLMLRAAELNDDPDNLHRGGRAGLDFMFDVPFLLAQLAQHCPQMPIAEDLYHVEGLENAVFPNLFWPPDLRSLATGDPPAPRPYPGIRNMDAATFRQDLDQHFGLPAAVNKPQILRLQRPLFQYPVATDPLAFVVRYGRLLKLHPVAHVLASQALAELRKLSDKYMAFHLRLEGDVGEKWGGFAEQAGAALARLLEREFAVVYVASGDPAPVARFKGWLADKAPGVKVVTKHSLLSTRPASQAKVASLHFDQQALIDYLLLLKSDYMVGNASECLVPTLTSHEHATNASFSRSFELLSQRAAQAAPRPAGPDGEARTVPAGRGRADISDPGRRQRGHAGDNVAVELCCRCN